MVDRTRFDEADDAIVQLRIDPTRLTIDKIDKPRCFLLMRSDKDMQGLLQYGDVVVIHGGERRPSFWAPAFVEHTYENMDRHQYQHGVDFVVAAGPLVPLVKVLCGLTKKYGYEPRMLFFDAARQGFVIG